MKVKKKAPDRGLLFMHCSIVMVLQLEVLRAVLRLVSLDLGRRASGGLVVGRILIMNTD